MGWTVEAEVQFIRGIGSYSGKDHSPADRIRKLQGYIEGTKIRFYSFDSRKTPMSEIDRNIVLKIASRELELEYSNLRRNQDHKYTTNGTFNLCSETSSIANSSPQTKESEAIKDLETVETGPVSKKPPTHH